MLKRVFLIAVLIAGTACFAGSAVRVDVNGLNAGVALKSGEASKGLRVINGSWLKARAKYYLMAYTGMNLSIA